MRKRKPPYIMIALIVGLLGAVGVFNALKVGVPLSNEQLQAKMMEEQRQAMQAAQKDAPTASKDQEAEKMRSALKAGSGSESEARRMPRPGDEGAPRTPSVATPKPTKYKPQPNATATSGQWYDENSNPK